ncbi:MAG: hypothetical protein BroJett003_00160 [Planctomycetota bacterium]|nr:MAG: hypothetical protein BroJett003_00160 [Planctomycetota bacterium]
MGPPIREPSRDSRTVSVDPHATARLPHSVGGSEYDCATDGFYVPINTVVLRTALVCGARSRGLGS